MPLSLGAGVRGRVARKHRAAAGMRSPARSTEPSASFSFAIRARVEPPLFLLSTTPHTKGMQTPPLLPFPRTAAISMMNFVVAPITTPAPNASLGHGDRLV